jgi:hypothetical protein
MNARQPFRAVLLVSLLVAGLVACRSVVDQGPRRVVGVIDNGNGSVDPPSLPDTVQTGVAFSATFFTFGGACQRPDGADVRTAGLVEDVTPYDLLSPPETICIDVLVAYPRSVTLTFATPGSGLVRLHGRDFNSGAPLTVQRGVTVRP